MTPAAILFGSIGTLSETSDMQRRAFNAAFAGAGLDWHWSAEDYAAMLRRPGGASRIEEAARARGERVDARALHAAKVEHFAALARAEGLAPRPGVAELIAAARDRGVRLGLVTATTPQTVQLVLQGLAGSLPPGAFDVVTDATMVCAPKPAPDVYALALDRLGLPAAGVLAIEDTPEAADAAIAAGVPTLAFPNAHARGRAFRGTLATREALAADLLDSDLTGAA